MYFSMLLCINVISLSGLSLNLGGSCVISLISLFHINAELACLLKCHIYKNNILHVWILECSRPSKYMVTLQMSMTHDKDVFYVTHLLKCTSAAFDNYITIFVHP